VLAVHALLGVAAVGTILTAGLSRALTGALFALALVPLAAATPGLLAGRRYTCQWLALVLVGYVGTAIVEVLASAARASFASLVLLAALAELALLLALIRQAPEVPRESRAP
jgi:uncharacterized membrane protein